MLHQEKGSRTYEIVVKEWTTCDFCKEKIDEPPYTTSEGKIEYEISTHYPEGGDKETETANVCRRCWVLVVLPWLKEKGVVPQIRKSDW